MFDRALDLVIAHLDGRKRLLHEESAASRDVLASLTKTMQQDATAASRSATENHGPKSKIENPKSRINGSQPKQSRLDALRATILDSARDPRLANVRQNLVFGVGNPDADLMFVGEAPGAEEDLQGEPFVGPAGQLLTKMILAMGIRREDVYIANIVKFRPGMPPGQSGNRKPTPDEMAACLPWLEEQIATIQPKVLVALGGTALEGLSGKPQSITKSRGSWATYYGIPLMPTFHPSYLLRNQSHTEKRKVWEDLLQVMEKLGLPISEKQRGYFLR
ncbi:MAG TPA: uracil-DNA glycosylase [Chthoniobacterales bacterium]